MTSLSIWYSLRSTNGRLMPCANALSISFEDAERIKNQIGLQNVTGDERLEKAEEVIRETTAQLIVGIRNTLNLYDVDHAGGTISGVVLTGTGARLIGLPPVLASSINKVVRIGDPFIRFRLSKEVERQNIMAHAIDLGAVLGLVIGKKPR
ncbi:pilus assembly protein PilM [Bifidobacterium pseudocatenulatum]|nr:pilus assembly protein PilM [Bifidobacterium pseudocatenulatum]